VPESARQENVRVEVPLSTFPGMSEITRIQGIEVGRQQASRDCTVLLLSGEAEVKNNKKKGSGALFRVSSPSSALAVHPDDPRYPQRRELLLATRGRRCGEQKRRVGDDDERRGTKRTGFLLKKKNSRDEIEIGRAHV
jgi:hypothetical protein